MTASSAAREVLEGLSGVTGVTLPDPVLRLSALHFGSKHPPPAIGAWVLVCLAFLTTVSGVFNLFHSAVRCVFSRARSQKGLPGHHPRESLFDSIDSNASRVTECVSRSPRSHLRLSTISLRNPLSLLSGIFGEGKTEVSGFSNPGTGSAGIPGAGSGPGSGAATCGTREKLQMQLSRLQGLCPEAQSRICLLTEGNRIH